MSCILKNVDYQSFVKFSNKLFQHQTISNTFFNESLLSYLEEYFNLHSSTLTVYDSSDYIGGVCYNTIDVSTLYRDYYKINPICQKIRHSYRGITPSPTADSLINATSVIPIEQYEQSEYTAFLNRMGFHYSIALPFGPSASYRITLFKNKYEGDFSDSELDVISGIYSILASSFDAFNKIRKNQMILDIKNTLISNKELGTIILGNDFKIIDYNEKAATYFTALSGYNNLKNACLELFSLKNIPIGTIKNTVQGHEIVLQPYSRTDDYHFITNYYLITIHKLSDESSFSKSYNDPLNLHCMTQREIEIIEKLATGLSYKEISSTLFISVSTVRNHLQNIYKKLGINNQRQLIRMYLNSH